MEIILCKNSTFTFDTIQLSRQNCLEPVIILTPKCDIQLPPGISKNSLTFEEKEYFEEVKEAAEKYHKKCGRHICVHLSFPIFGDIMDSLKVHGFLWEDEENVEEYLRQDWNLKLMISISMSVLECRNNSFIAPVKAAILTPKLGLDGDSGTKLSEKAADTATKDPWPTLDPAKFKDIVPSKSTNKEADGTIMAKSLEVTVDTSQAKSPPTPTSNSEENLLVKMSKTKANTSSTMPEPVTEGDSPPSLFRFGFQPPLLSPACRTTSETEDNYSSLPKISPLRSKPGDGVEKQNAANISSAKLSEKLKALRSTPACYLTHLELPLNFTRKMSASDSHSCGWKPCQEYFTETQALEFPENLRSFLTQKLFQSSPFFLAGIINVSLVCGVAEARRPSDQLSICRRILQDEVKSDMEIVADNGEIIKCHKSFLAVQSKVFTEMMENDSREELRIEMRNMSKENIDAFLQYIYTGDVSRPNQDPEVALELLKAARKYEIVSLKCKMKEILNAKMDDWCSVEVAVGLFLFLQDVADSDDLKMRTIRVMKAKPEELRGCELYQNIFKTNPGVALDLCTHLLRI